MQIYAFSVRQDNFIHYLCEKIGVMESLVCTLVLVGVAVLLLGVKVFFVKGGRFPNIHIGGNKAMRQRGISCATSQDREAQQTTADTHHKA